MKRIDSFIVKMREEGVPEPAIAMFARYYGQLAAGKNRTIRESDILPAEGEHVESLESLNRYHARGIQALGRTAVVKLNGGLATTMGMSGPKSLLEAKKGLTFLDIIIKQMQHVREVHDLNSPLVLMNSFFTATPTLKVLESYRRNSDSFLYSFDQHKYPKVLAETLEPASSPADRLLEWNPAGHGDLLLAIKTSGVLDRLLEAGYRYLFVSNIDNLGAGLDTAILGYFQSEQLDFLMEVTERTPMDRKGGHLARYEDGRLMLREASQCDEDDLVSCTNIARHSFFNTNNLWLSLESVQRLPESKKLDRFPFLVNPKRLNPRDPSTPKVYQIESALGSAIELFERSAAVRVPRSRFSPVKNCEDILLLRSDYYSMDKHYRVFINPARKLANVEISLDPAYYADPGSLQARFPYGPPSLIECEAFSLKGDVMFGRNVRVRGTVSIANHRPYQVRIEDESLIEGDLVFH
jgi:UTP--glucose-1-phosphate uridylyltransferase